MQEPDFYILHQKETISAEGSIVASIAECPCFDSTNFLPP